MRKRARNEAENGKSNAKKNNMRLTSKSEYLVKNNVRRTYKGSRQ